MADGDDHVGKFAEAQEHIADIGSLELDLLEPRLFGVIATLQVIGAGIAELVALVVDQPQVHEARELAAHDLEDAGQIGVVGQFVEACRPRR